MHCGSLVGSNRPQVLYLCVRHQPLTWSARSLLTKAATVKQATAKQCNTSQVATMLPRLWVPSHLGSSNAADLTVVQLIPKPEFVWESAKAAAVSVIDCLLQSWESKAKHASNDRETAQKQVAELQERLDAQGSSAQQSSQAIRAIEHRTAALQRQMQVKVPVTQCLPSSVCHIMSAAECMQQLSCNTCHTVLAMQCLLYSACHTVPATCACHNVPATLCPPHGACHTVPAIYCPPYSAAATYCLPCHANIVPGMLYLPCSACYTVPAILCLPPCDCHIVPATFCLLHCALQTVSLCPASARRSHDASTVLSQPCHKLHHAFQDKKSSAAKCPRVVVLMMLAPRAHRLLLV